jgi:Protein of unknown function (DUF2958)
MKNEPTKEMLNEIPNLYETDDIQLEDKIIHLHFFLGGCDWYVAEFDGEDTFFGFVVLNDDLEMAEWGYISFGEIKAIDVYGLQVEYDTHWQIRKASEIGRICEAQRWSKQE